MRLSVGAVESLPMLLECEADRLHTACEGGGGAITAIFRNAGAPGLGRPPCRCFFRVYWRSAKLIAAAADKHHSGRSADSPRLGGSGDGGGAVEAYDKLWSQLRNTERVAAASLGWDAASCVSVAAPPLVLALPHCVVAVTDGTAGAQCAQHNGAL